MATKVAQTWLSSKYPDKENTDEIILGKNSSNNEGDELTGELIIDGYKNLEIINLEREDANSNLLQGSITKVTIRNCPKLKKVDFDWNKITDIRFEGDFSELRHLDVRKNNLVGIDVSLFPFLKDLDVHENSNFNKVEGMEYLTRLKRFFAISTKGVNFKGFKAWKDKINEMLGNSVGGVFPTTWKADLDAKLGGSTLKDIPAGETLKSLIQSKPHLESELDKEKKENARLKAKEKLLAQIVAKLSLEKTATDKEILEKIEALINKPTTVNCSHTDYDAIKRERDNAKKEIRDLKAEIASLKNNNGKDGKTVEYVEIIKQLNKWGINTPESTKTELKNYSKQALNDYRDKSVINKITTLESDKEKVSYLNIGLGALTIASWLIVCWMLMQQTNLPETEPKLKKVKK